MCWNASSSLAGFLWGFGHRPVQYVHSVRAKSTRDLWLDSGFLVIFSIVQGLEALLWQWGDIQESNLKYSRPLEFRDHVRQTECNMTNQFITGYFLPAVLVFECTYQVVRAYLYCCYNQQRTISWTLIFLAAVWTALGVQYRYPSYVAPRPLCTTSLLGRYLLWGDVPYTLSNRSMTAHFLLGTFGIGLPFLALRKKCGLVYCLFTVLTSFAVYYVHSPTWASNWCFVALSGSILILLDPWVFEIPKRDLLKAEENDKKKVL